MTNRLRLLPVLTLLSVLLLSPCLAFCANSLQSMSYEDWVEHLKNQAFNQGISQETIQFAFLGIKQNEQIVNLVAQPEPIPVERYLSPQQIELQRNLLQQYGNMLFEISHLFGVEPELLVAIWTLDNLQSSEKPAFNVVELLVTRSFHQPGNKMLQVELFNALKLIDNKQVNPATFTCDENGLLGSAFFKPSVLRDYGIDHDGDGIINIWTSYADIFASMANYLNSIGWKPKESWGMEVQLPTDFASTNQDLHRQYTIDYWRNSGIKLANGNELPAEISLGAIISADTSSNKTYLVLDNYFVLLRLKRSKGFALAIGQTIDQLTQKHNAESAINPAPQTN